jgi:PD-(D/E)XK endonuclease
MASEESFIQLPKARGEWAELRFMARAAEHGLTVSKPWGESKHYDFVVEHERCLLRVQVKSTTSAQRQGRGYRCRLRGATVYYTKDDFDFIVIYIIPRDLWYIIPSAIAITGRDHLCLAPDYAKSIYEPYREAWHLLKQHHCTLNIRDCDLCFRYGCPARLHEEPAIEKL